MSGFLQSRNVRFPISTSHGRVSAEQAVAARRGVPARATGFGFHFRIDTLEHALEAELR
jgi:NAD dependent epimerase/dehydratase family enzyme